MSENSKSNNLESHHSKTVRHLSAQMSDLVKQANIKAAQHQEDRERIIMYHSRRQIEAVQCHHLFNMRSALLRSVLHDTFPLQQSSKLSIPPSLDIVPPNTEPRQYSPHTHFVHSFINFSILLILFFTLFLLWIVSSMKQIQFQHSFIMDYPSLHGIPPISDP